MNPFLHHHAVIGCGRLLVRIWPCGCENICCLRPRSERGGRALSVGGKILDSLGLQNLRRLSYMAMLKRDVAW